MASFICQLLSSVYELAPKVIDPHCAYDQFLARITREILHHTWFGLSPLMAAKLENLSPQTKRESVEEVDA